MTRHHRAGTTILWAKKEADGRRIADSDESRERTSLRDTILQIEMSQLPRGSTRTPRRPTTLRTLLFFDDYSRLGTSLPGKGDDVVIK